MIRFVHSFSVVHVVVVTIMMIILHIIIYTLVCGAYISVTHRTYVVVEVVVAGRSGTWEHCEFVVPVLLAQLVLLSS